MTMVCAVFIVLLCLVLSLTTYWIYTTTMFDRYQKQMASILDYVESRIDIDDMAVCARTYEESEAYQEFQAFFDDFIDHYQDVHFLYIMQVVEPGDPLRTREICAANSTYEKEFEPELVLHLGDAEAGWYDPEMEDRFYAIQMGDEDVYLINASEWGMDYTLARPLVSSGGDHYGLLCVDVSVEELNAVVYRNIHINIAVIIVSGILFSLMLLLWMRSSVIKPLKLLDQSVVAFAETSTGKRNPDDLLYTPPDIRAKNEVRHLSDAIAKLSEDMKDYVKRMIEAEDENKGLQAHVTEMNTLAFQDALTKVKNKAAYDQKEEALNRDIQNQTAQFGIVMIDLNHLKETNDRYGHEHGNEYLIGTCRIICDVYKHSSVYRVGGDEFVVVIQGADYKEKDRLLKKLRELIADSAADETREPWKRYSAAVGMAVYQPGDDVEAVFRRADQKMYKAKSVMKADGK